MPRNGDAVEKNPSVKSWISLTGADVIRTRRPDAARERDRELHPPAALAGAQHVGERGRRPQGERGVPAPRHGDGPAGRGEDVPVRVEHRHALAVRRERARLDCLLKTP